MSGKNKKPLRFTKRTRHNEELEDYNEERQSQIASRRKPHYKQSSNEVFKCRHCHHFVVPLPYGGHHRNHCPYCLYSRHVDDRKPGDRMSTCGASMEPAGYFQRPNGEYVIVHRCMGCTTERFCRIAADDEFDLVLALQELPPRTRREVKAHQVEEYLAEQQDLPARESEDAG